MNYCAMSGALTLVPDLAAAGGDSGLARLMAIFARTCVLLFDDLGLRPLTSGANS